MLDGFPRTLRQLEHLRAAGVHIDLAVQYVIPAKVAISRLLSRRQCERCRRTATTGADVLCAACGGAMARRPDDTPSSILRRFELFHQETQPVLAWLDAEGRLIRVSGLGDEAAVARRTWDQLASISLAPDAPTRRLAEVQTHAGAA